MRSVGEEFLFKNQEEKERSGDEGAFPQTSRFLDQSREPLKAVLHEPGIFVAPDIAGIEIKNATDCPDKFHTQLLFVPIYPLFLLRRRHTHPKHIRFCRIYGFYHPAVLFFGKFILKRWRISSNHFNVRKIFCLFPPLSGPNARPYRGLRVLIILLPLGLKYFYLLPWCLFPQQRLSLFLIYLDWLAQG